MKRNLAKLLILAIAVCVLMTSCTGIDKAKKKAAALAQSVTSDASTLASEASSEVTSALTTASKTASTTKKPTTAAKAAPTAPKKTTTTTKPTVAKQEKTVQKEVTLTQDQLDKLSGTTKKPSTEDTSVVKGIQAVSPTNYYGRQQLMSMGNGNYIKAYDDIVGALENFSRYTKISSYQLSCKDIARIFTYVIDDYPQFYYVDKGYSVAHTGSYDQASVIYFQYTYSKSEVTSMNAQVDSALAEITKGITTSTSEFDRVKLIYDRIIAKDTYDSNAHNCYNMYGSLVEGRCVCEGYSRAFQRIMYQLGVPCVIAKSEYYDEYNNLYAHAWNMVKIGSSWYHLDATWGDQRYSMNGVSKSYADYSYLNLTDSQIRLDHQPTREWYEITTGGQTITDENFYISYALPAANSTEMNYLSRTGQCLTDPTAAQLTSYLKEKKNEGMSVVTIRFSGSFTTAMNATQGLRGICSGYAPNSRRSTITYLLVTD